MNSEQESKPGHTPHESSSEAYLNHRGITVELRENGTFCVFVPHTFYTNGNGGEVRNVQLLPDNDGMPTQKFCESLDNGILCESQVHLSSQDWIQIGRRMERLNPSA